MKTEFTGATKVWLSDTRWKSMDELQQLLADGEHDKAVGYVEISRHDMSTSGWVEIGTATMTVTLHDPELVVGKQVEALRQELQNVRAEAQMQENAILARISKLQAITYTPEA